MRPFFVFQNFGNGSHNPLGQTVPTSKGNLKKFSVAFRLIRGQESRREVLVLKPEIFMAIGGADDGAGWGTAAIRFRRRGAVPVRLPWGIPSYQIVNKVRSRTEFL